MRDVFAPVPPPEVDKGRVRSRLLWFVAIALASAACVAAIAYALKALIAPPG